VASHLALHPPGRLLRHKKRLNLGEQGTTFGKCESQVGKATVVSFYHGNNRCVSRTRFVILYTGLNDQSHSTSDRLSTSPA
jgi:hypothetical protein